MLHAADSIAGCAGRTMLAKILKGSRDKKLLALGLNDSIAYGYYRRLTIANITERVDWMIKNDFLSFSWVGEMPVLVFTERGREIQREQLADLLLSQWKAWVEAGIPVVDMTYLKDRDRSMILLFLQKIANSRDARYIPLLKQWELVDYRKVRHAIGQVIVHLQQGTNQPLVLEGAPVDAGVGDGKPIIGERKSERLKCRDCGARFDWTVEEQDSFRMRGWDPPKRCRECRKERSITRLFDFDGWI
ncbi:hypothetical protein PbJCM17693_46330 [Paenibacillus macerans]|nr:hypothetical protein PbJCM17693_46330 [Paenibacillus macerans]